jgi:hypothetical protein
MSTGPKKGCWKCGEPHYHCNFRVERTRESRSVEPNIVGGLGKVHQIHAVMNNHKVEHHSTVLKTLGTIVDQTICILIDLGATESFIFCTTLKRIKVKVDKQD